jgi:small-conductance mechanosensitive channel
MDTTTANSNNAADFNTFGSASRKTDSASSSASQHAQQQQQQQQQQQAARQAIRHTLEEMRRHATLAGSVRPLLQKLRLSSTELMILTRSIKAIAHWEDLAVILLLGWGTVPALQVPYQWWIVRRRQNKLRKGGTIDHPHHGGGASYHRPSFSGSLLKVAGEHVQHVMKIALAVYAVDVVKMACIGIGVSVGGDALAHLPHCFAQSAYTIYGANRLVKLKKHYLNRYVSRHPEVFGRAKLLNRLVDAAVYGLASLVVLSFLQLEMGIAVRSVLALGSVGTLAFGLASQGILSQILHGLLLASSDRIYEGDSIRLANGQKGTIEKLGWLETTVRGSDNVMVSVPNADLVKQHVSNLSRVRYSQVAQVLRFRPQDAGKLPDLCQSIRQEIQLACGPDLVLDGSRPFRAYWTDIGPDGSLEVTVDVHFYIRPTSEQYWENRQKVLLAIHSACALHQVELFSPPSALPLR